MVDIYATPASDVVQRTASVRDGGNIEDAIDGKIDVAMLETLGAAWRALEVSRKAVTRIWFRAAGFLLLIMLLITLGMIPLGIPLIWIVPWVTLAYAMLYFKLFGTEARTLAD